jgi:hypothetical protein
VAEDEGSVAKEALQKRFMPNFTMKRLSIGAKT